MSWTVFVLVCTAVWLVLGPAQLGGPVTYIIVDGPSMEPTYHEGDLVIARARASYSVGDVVAYLPDIGQRFPVIHRIVGVEGEGQYVTQGDNRAQPDGWLATDDNIFGAAWAHLTSGGRFVVFLRQPATWLAIAVAFSGLGLIARAGRGRAPAGGERRGRHVKRYLLIPPILILAACTANAADLAVEGGVLQEFRFESESGVTGAHARENLSNVVDTTAPTTTVPTTTVPTTTTTTTVPTTTTTVTVPTTTTTVITTAEVSWDQSLRIRSPTAMEPGSKTRA